MGEEVSDEYSDVDVGLCWGSLVGWFGNCEGEDEDVEDMGLGVGGPVG